MKMLTTYLSESAVYYTAAAYRMRMEIVHRCDKEVGWIGLGDELDNGDWLIDELIVLPQEVHPTECEFEDEAVSDWAESYIEKGGDTTRFVLWGHSHVDMTVSPSTTDYEQAAKYIKNCDKFICAIYNKNGESRHDVYYRGQGYMFEDVFSGVWIPKLSEERSAALDKVLKENVKARKLPVVGGKGGVTYSYTNSTPQLTHIQKMAYDKLPANPLDCDAKVLAQAGFRMPNATFKGKDKSDHLGLVIADYIAYFLNGGINGSPSDVYADIYGTDVDVWDSETNEYGWGGYN